MKNNEPFFHATVTSKNYDQRYHFFYFILNTCIFFSVPRRTVKLRLLHRSTVPMSEPNLPFEIYRSGTVLLRSVLKIFCPTPTRIALFRRNENENDVQSYVTLERIMFAVSRVFFVLVTKTVHA